MNKENIETLIAVAKSSGLSELKYENKEEKIHIKFPYAEMPITTVIPAVEKPTISQAATKNTQDNASRFSKVTSPFVGTFYRSPSPDTEAYVKVGDTVSAGQVLCIVEAMKIMNEIEAEVSGKVVEICVENENYVEYGQTLFKIDPR